VLPSSAAKSKPLLGFFFFEMYEFVSLLMYTSKENKNEEFIAQMLLSLGCDLF
jgi:hypothetical protein